MKLLNFYSIFLILIFTFSCKKTETIYIEKKETLADIFGTWQILGDSNILQNRYYVFPPENPSTYFYLNIDAKGIKNKTEGLCKIYKNHVELDYQLFNLLLIDDTMIITGYNNATTRFLKVKNPDFTIENWIKKLNIEKIFPALSYKYRYSLVSFAVDENYLYFNGDNLDESVLKSYIYKMNKNTGVLEDSLAVYFRDCGVSYNNEKFYYYYYFASLYKVFTTNGFNNNFAEFSPYLISNVYSILALPNDSVLIGNWNKLKIGTPTAEFKDYKDYNVNNNPDVGFIGKLEHNFLTLSNYNNYFSLVANDSKNTVLKTVQFESNYSFSNFSTFKKEIWAYARDNRNNNMVFLKINLD